MLFQKNLVLNNKQFLNNKTPLVFDIETTGLSPRNSHLYLLGILWPEENELRSCQFFLDRPSGEAQLLREFMDYVRRLADRRACRLVHYNGSTFDLPYIDAKCRQYNIENVLSRLPGTDVYRCMRPLQVCLGLSSMRQKDLETCMGISREDTMSGRELIEVYREYLLTGDPALLEMLKLHNSDDISGLYALLPVLSLPDFLNGRFTSHDLYEKEDQYVFSLLPEAKLPEPLRLHAEKGDYRLDIPGSCGPCTAAADGGSEVAGETSAAPLPSLSIKKHVSTLKLFFPDYRNYFYLPQEDMAIHKSVAQFTDASHRQKATARTCYQKHTAAFLQQPAEVFTPVFRREYGAKAVYFQLSDLKSAQPEKIRTYVLEILKDLLSRP